MSRYIGRKFSFLQRKLFKILHSVSGFHTVCLFQSPFLLTQSWMGGNGIFWSPDTREASQAASSHEIRSLYFCQYLKVLPWNWGLFLDSDCGESWTHVVRPTLLTSPHLRKNLFEVRIHLYSAENRLLFSDLPPKPETWIKMNTPAGAEHPRALHLVGDLLHHLLRHLPRPLPLLRHWVLKLLLLLLWQERSTNFTVAEKFS